MTVFKNELRRGSLSLIIWTAAISFMLAVCVLIYPQMESQMAEMSDMMAEMGSLSSAFGVDKLNLNEFIGYFGNECGSVLGLGGLFFAALTGVSALAKEEKGHTAEFLLTHPVSRASVVTQKLLSVLVQIITLNVITAAAVALTIVIIGESVEIGILALIFLAYLLMQIEVGVITFGISAFVSRGSIAVGLGAAAGLYFMNIIANLSNELEFIKYITPFGYTECAGIINDKTLNWTYVSIGMGIAAVSIIAAYIKYTKKDIS